VGGPSSVDEIAKTLCETTARSEWTPYERGWLNDQKRGTKSKSGTQLARWQAAADEGALELFAAHIVPATRVGFNPLLGKGGSAGNRDFSDGWRRVVGLLSTGITASNERESTRHLCDLLAGQPVEWLVTEAALFPNAPAKQQKKGSLNASSWFSESNKISNSGQRPFREGAISPWAMVLACEGLVFFAGGASRRLGSRAGAVAAFPFVVQAAAPTANGEAGRDLGEVWAPIWSRPMTVAEVTALFRAVAPRSAGAAR
jgi:CRISPR-associated protein Csx17